MMKRGKRLGRSPTRRYVQIIADERFVTCAESPRLHLTAVVLKIDCSEIQLPARPYKQTMD